MAIELKDALAAWKKAKPLTLTKTGISESIRTLGPTPQYPTDFKTDIKRLEAVKKTLEVAIANKHVRVHKKAYDCLKEILESVNKQIVTYQKQYEAVKVAYKNVMDAGYKFLESPGLQTEAVVKTRYTEFHKVLDAGKYDERMKRAPYRVRYFAIGWMELQRRYEKEKTPAAAELLKRVRVDMTDLMKEIRSYAP